MFGRTRTLLSVAWRGAVAHRASLVMLVLAAAAGVGFQIVNVANLAGYQRALVAEGIEHALGDLRISPRRGGRFARAAPIVRAVAAAPGVRTAVALTAAPGAVGKQGHIIGAAVVGVDMSGAALPFRLAEGRLLERGERRGLVLGTALARRLGVRVGEHVSLRVVLTSAGAAIDGDGLLRARMIVRGLAAGSFGAHDQIFVDRAFLCAELGEPDAASLVIAHLAHHEDAATVGAALANALPAARVERWNDEPYLKSSLATASAIGGVSRLMVAAAVGVPVAALLFIQVLRRRRELSLLGALGFARWELVAIVMLQALLVTLAGAVLGALLGAGLITYFQAHPLFQWEGFVVHPNFALRTFIAPALFVTITALLAALYPAITAARTDTARVLREVN
ncbi:MAG: FtsX-like permease family protein [Myxococcales bacterium]|nr:FtsX-like permease family protein [Myxococcales bacterium]